ASAELVGVRGWQVLVGRLKGSAEVATSVVLPGRLHTELAGSIGAFSRPVPVGVSLTDTDTFAEVLDRVARAAGEATSWQDYLGDTPALGVGFVSADAAPRIEAGGVVFSARDAVLAADGHAAAFEWVRIGDSGRATPV